MKRFQDSDGLIIVEDGDRTAILNRSQFIRLEPEYSLPSGCKTRFYDGQVHWLIDSNGQQKIASDVPKSLLDSFIGKAEVYQKKQYELKPVASPDESFDRLAAALRNSEAWQTMFMAMGQSIKANAAGSLLLFALTTTKNINDLKAGYLSLLDAMSDPDVAEFSESALIQIRDALDQAGFIPSEFGFD